MSIKILCGGDEEDIACFYDSVYDKAFGPIIHGNNQFTADEVAADFLDWADYTGAKTSIDANTIYDLWNEYQQDIAKFKWPLPEME